MVRRAQCKPEGWRFESRGRRDSLYFSFLFFLSVFFVLFCLFVFFFIKIKKMPTFLNPRHLPSTLDILPSTLDSRLSIKTYTLVFHALYLTGRRHDGDRRFIEWARLFVKASWLNIRRKCCKACGTGTQERYCLI